MESTHRACSFDGCDRPYSASGYCRTHYEQHRRGAGAQPRNRTGVRGVSWSKPVHKWQAQVGHNMGRVHLGYFDSVEEAGRAALSKRNELFTNNLRDRPPILQRLGITDPLEDTQPARPKETP